MAARVSEEIMSCVLPFVCRRGFHSTVVAAGNSHRFVICGGGTGGLAVASSLARRFGEKQVAVIEPNDVSLQILNVDQLYRHTIINQFGLW